MAKKTARESILQEKTVKSPKVKVVADERVKSLKTMSFLSILIVVLICFVFNILLGVTLDKTLTYDATSVHINTVGTYTKNLLKNMDKKVEIYGLFNKNDTSLEWHDYLVPIVDDYEAKADGKISVSYIDPDTNPFIISELDPDGLYGVKKNRYVIKCEDRLVCIDPYNCLNYDQSIANQYNIGVLTGNDVEFYFTGYIQYVISDNPLRAFYLTGHGETNQHNSLDTILVSIGIKTDTLDITKEGTSLPSKCDLIMILQPRQDISESERDLLKLYLQNGGKMLVVNDFNENKTVDYTNLNQLCNQMGISLEAGLLHENDTTCLIKSDDPYTSWGLLNTDYMGDGYEWSAYYTSHNRYLSVYHDKAEGISVYPLLTTSETASVEFLNMNVSGSVSEGMYPIVLKGQDTGEKGGELLVFATQSLTSDDYYDMKTLNDPNAEFVRHSIGSICQQEVKNVQIPVKTIPNYALGRALSSNEVTMWSIVVMTIIPVGCLACGFYIYRKRRHL